MRSSRTPARRWTNCRLARSSARRACGPLHHAETAACTSAERAFSRALSGSCHTPLAAHALARDGNLWLRGFLASADGSRVLRGEATGPLADPETLGASLAADFLARGGAAILATTGLDGRADSSPRPRAG